MKTIIYKVIVEEIKTISSKEYKEAPEDSYNKINNIIDEKRKELKDKTKKENIRYDVYALKVREE